MRKTALLIAFACIGLAACGKGGSDNTSAEAPPPLYENPPFGASDIDATVDETRKRMAPQSPAADTATNSQEPTVDTADNGSTN